MDSLSSSTVAAAASTDPATVQGSVDITLMKQALNIQASATAQLIQSLPQPSLATEGSVGTRVNTYA